MFLIIRSHKFLALISMEDLAIFFPDFIHYDEKGEIDFVCDGCADSFLKNIGLDNPCFCADIFDFASYPLKDITQWQYN